MNNFNTISIGRTGFVYSNKSPTPVIFTKMGWLPNDVDAMQHSWGGAASCGGFADSMSRSQFLEWWACRVEAAYLQHTG